MSPLDRLAMIILVLERIVSKSANDQSTDLIALKTSDSFSSTVLRLVYMHFFFLGRDVLLVDSSSFSLFDSSELDSFTRLLTARASLLAGVGKLQGIVMQVHGQREMHPVRVFE